MRSHRSFDPVLVLALGLTVAGVQGCSCRPEEPSEAEWIAVDETVPPGTPAEVRLDATLSDQSQTTVEVRIHGFWVEEKKGPDGALYQRVSIPGLGSHDEIGAPDLPLLRFEIAVPTAAMGAQLEVGKSAFKKFPGYNIWPQPVPEMDHEEGEPEQFRRNEDLYALDRPWPESEGKSKLEVTTRFRSIPAISAEIWPVRWNPATKELEIAASSRYTYRHGGEVMKFEPITKERHALAASSFLNWAQVEKHWIVNAILYTGSFLVIYPTAAYQDELLPFVQQKASLGFAVTEMTVADIGGTCAQIRAAIQAWEASVPASHDAYCLLVGDDGEIPLCTSPTGVPTDDLYASTNGDDLDEEVFLGRLSVDSEADAANQIAKILAYETAPNPFCCYHMAGLWAHKEDAPGKYEGAHESVRTNTYSDVVPLFETIYGSQAGVADATVSQRVNDGVGVLAYRGHGSATATATSWNLGSEYYDSADVIALTNLVNRSPVLWSFACTNTALATEDSISEVWMEQANTASVSYYGATVPSATSQNHELDREMFLAVFDQGLVTQSHAIQLAEQQMAAAGYGSGNAWMYLLLGDPDLQIRRENPIAISPERLQEVYECTPLCWIRIRIVDERINPVAGGLMGLWKPSAVAGEPEVFVNGYANEQGELEFQIEPGSSGTVYFGVQDGLGNGAVGTFEVRVAAR